MVISVKASKKSTRDDDTVTAPENVEADGGQSKTAEDSDLGVLQKSLLEAQKNAESARAIVTEAMTRVYRENRASKKRAEALVKAFDEAIESAIEQSKITAVSENYHTGGERKLVTSKVPGSTNIVKTGLLQRILNNGNSSLNAISEITRSLFGNESLDKDTGKEFYDLVAGQSKQLRQLIDSAVEEQSHKKAEKIVERAKSEIAAAQVVVTQAQREVDAARNQAQAAREEARRARGAAEESMNIAEKRIKDAEIQIEKARADTEEAIKLAQESVKQAREEALAEKKGAEVIISQAKQESMSQMAGEMKAAKEEVEAAREAADNAIRRSAEEIEKSRAEVKAAQNNAQVVAALAQEKVRKAAEEIEEIKKRTQFEISQANDEALKAKEDAARVLKESRSAIDKAHEESRLAQEKAEKAIKEAEAARAIAEEKAYDHFRDEMDRVAEEVEIAKKNALEAIVRSREESRQAQEEAETARKAGEQAMRQAQEEVRSAKEEAATVKQAALEEVAALKEELRKSREDAEARIIKANEVMTQATHDIVSQTREEITRTREAIEMASQHPETVLERTGEPGASPSKSGKIDVHYISAMLHEMRTPLHSISGFARLMLQDDVPDTMTRQEFLSILVQQSDTLNNLLDDLAENLNAGSRGFEINKAAVSPNELINDVIHSVRNIALEKNILIGSAIPDSLPDVEADEARIKQVLNNLIDNALKFNEGDSTVIIKARVLENELMILVEDHGIGIPEGEAQTIFDEYYRASNHGDREGQGIGLNICKQIVESHGGRIHVESVEGEGSTFGFTLPLASV
jgi:signal transduction histidine kinase